MTEFNSQSDWITGMRQFLEMSDTELQEFDIAELNLLCATHLEQSQRLDVAERLTVVDSWAALIARETNRLLPRFHRSPAEFGNSEEYFRALVMVTILQRDLGVRYEYSVVEDPVDFRDSRLWFIHGMLMGLGGTCASLPILYVAVGRRLGYPLKLVAAKEHLFVRWGQLNIEATNRGLNCYPDEHYRQWPSRITEEEVRRGWYLRPLTAREELACSVATRGHCLLQYLELDAALEAFRLACALAPRNPNYRGFTAIATILLREARRLSHYDGEGCVVSDESGTRTMEPWERWAYRQAMSTKDRIMKVLDREWKEASHDELFHQAAIA